MILIDTMRLISDKSDILISRHNLFKQLYRLIRCYVNLSENDIALSDLCGDLSENYVDLSDIFCCHMYMAFLGKSMF